jgi:hypothetical protein
MDATLDAMISRLREVLGNRQSLAACAGRHNLAIKWEREAKILCSLSHAKVLFANDIDPDVFRTLAIYATQKVRRIISASLGAGEIDPYTAALLTNAMTSGALSSNDMLATLSPCRAPSTRLTISRGATENTANTQASSTRLALIAMGIAKIEKRGAERFTIINMKHPLIEQLMVKHA